MNRTIHFAGDGLGPRKVFVNGNQIDGVFLLISSAELFGIIQGHSELINAVKVSSTSVL